MNNAEKSKLLREIRKRLGWTQPRMAAALGLDVSYISQLENAKRAVDDWYLTRAREIERGYAIEKSKSDTLAEQGPQYLAARGAEIRAKSHRYLDQVLDACQNDLDCLAWTYVELRRHFPVADPDPVDDPLTDAIAGGTAGRVIVEAAQQQAEARRLDQQRPPPPPPTQSPPPKSSGPEKK